MFIRFALIAAAIPMTGYAQNVDLSQLPEPIAKFCTAVFDGKIAGSDQQFNSTDDIDSRLPMRRIIDFATVGDSSFLWFEHGGLFFHQHLVRFRNDRPEEILESYVLGAPIDRPIDQVIANRSNFDAYDVKW